MCLFKFPETRGGRQKKIGRGDLFEEGAYFDLKISASK